MNTRQIISSLAGGGAAVGAAALLVFTNRPFVLLGGSDAAATIMAPPIIPQLLAALLFGVSVASFGFGNRLSGRWLRIAALVVAIAAVWLAGHRVVFDAVTAEVRDQWLLFTAQHLSFDPVDGPAASFERSTSMLWLVLESRNTPPLRIFRGVPPWRLDTGAIDLYWNATGSADLLEPATIPSNAPGE